MLPLPVDLACPPPGGLPGLSVELLEVARMRASANRVLPRAEGEIEMVARVGLLHHPEALVAIDGAFGREAVDGRYPRGAVAATFDLVEVRPLVDLLPRPPDLVLLTHSHFDHVGGLVDLPGVPVLLDRRELGHLLAQGLGIPRSRWHREVAWRPVDLRSARNDRVLGRPALDVLGDGSVWMIATPGHTPGHAAVLVRAQDGPYLFVGDTAWVNAHLDDRQRPWWVSLLVDYERPALRESLAWVRWLHDSCPDLRVVTGHDPVAPVRGGEPALPPPRAR